MPGITIDLVITTAMRATHRLGILLLALLGAASCQRALPPLVSDESESESDLQKTGAGLRPMIYKLASLPREESGNERLSPGELCSLDGLGEKTFTSGQISLSAAVPVLIHGWVGIKDGVVSTPDTVLVRIKSIDMQGNSWGVELPVGTRRQDVAGAQGEPALMNAGLESVLDLSALPAARYRVSMIFGKDKKYICDGGWIVEVRP